MQTQTDKAITDLQQQNDTLKQRVSDMETKDAKTQKRILHLEQELDLLKSQFRNSREH